MSLSSRIRLVLPFEEVGFNNINLSRVGDALCVAYPFFIIAKESRGISGIRAAKSADNPVP